MNDNFETVEDILAALKRQLRFENTVLVFYALQAIVHAFLVARFFHKLNQE